MTSAALALQDDEAQADELSGFVSFIRANPGRLYRDDRKRHEECMAALVISPKCAVCKSSINRDLTITPRQTHKILPHTVLVRHPQ